MVPKKVATRGCNSSGIEGGKQRICLQVFQSAHKGKRRRKAPTSTQKNYAWKMATIYEYDCVRFKLERAVQKARALRMILTAYSLFICWVSIHGLSLLTLLANITGLNNYYLC